jgi:outer membrane autotransporter protein
MKNRGILGGALVVALASSVSTVAMAQCTATGAAGIVGAQFAPFAAGGSLNSLISAINASNTAFLTQSTAFVGAPGNPRPNQEGGGIWVRGIGGEVDTKAGVSSNFTYGGAPGTVNCNASTNLTFAGTQVGTDMAKLNWNGWNVHMGSMAGYLSATARDTTGAGPTNLAGSLKTELEVPFVGVYAAATYGGFFIDGQLRWDFYQARLSDPANNGLFGQQVDARGLAFTGNLGYNFQLGNNWFLEPSAGIVISEVKVDPILASGTFLLGTGAAYPNMTFINPIRSTLGRLSLRTGTTIVTDSMIWQPFATASVYHDFAGNARATYAENTLDGLLAPPSINATLSTQNVGTYGQFGVGIAGQIVNTGWLGYVRGDYRTGDRIEGYSVNGGLRYQFQPDPQPMAGKGLIGKAPALAVNAPINWSGLYIGGTFGAINGDAENNFTTFVGKVKPRFAGPLAGGQIGYNWQAGKWVFGVEGNMNWVNATGSRACPNGFFFGCENEMNWFGMATAKLGYALFDRSYYYVKGGAAFAENRSGTRCNTGAVPVDAFYDLFVPISCVGATPMAGGMIGGGQVTGRATNTHVGWTVGFGSEFALTNNWFVRGETNYFDLGKENYAPGPGYGPRDVSLTGFVSTVGLNYRFSTGGAPIKARY